MNIFKIVKAAVSAKAVAERYGLKVSNKGMARCPFHDDRNPSMKVDERFYCFGCGAKGDAVDLVAQLLGIGKYEAAVRIAEDFGVVIDNENTEHSVKVKPKARASPVITDRMWIEHSIGILFIYLDLLEFWKCEYAPQTDESWHPLFCEALYKTEIVRNILDNLLLMGKGDYPFARELYRKEVREIEERLERYVRGDERENRRNPWNIGEDRKRFDKTVHAELCSGFIGGSPFRWSNPSEHSYRKNRYCERPGMAQG